MLEMCISLAVGLRILYLGVNFMYVNLGRK